MLLMSENVYPLAAVRGPERGEHHFGLVDIYFNDELSAGDPAKPGPGQGGWGMAEKARAFSEESREGTADPSRACVAIGGSRASGAI